MRAYQGGQGQEDEPVWFANFREAVQTQFTMMQTQIAATHAQFTTMQTQMQTQFAATQTQIAATHAQLTTMQTQQAALANQVALQFRVMQHNSIARNRNALAGNIHPLRYLLHEDISNPELFGKAPPPEVVAAYPAHATSPDFTEDKLDVLAQFYGAHTTAGAIEYERIKCFLVFIGAVDI